MRALLARDLCEPAPARARSTLYACCSLHLRALRTLIDFYACYSLHLRALRTRIEIYASTLPLELARLSMRAALCSPHLRALCWSSRSMRAALYIYAHCALGSRSMRARCRSSSLHSRLVCALLSTSTRTVLELEIYVCYSLDLCVLFNLLCALVQS